jgi:hypothetical protein
VKYAGMPWMRKYPSVRYAVLGHYLVTHSWVSYNLTNASQQVFFGFQMLNFDAFHQPELESIGDHSNVRRFRFKCKQNNDDRLIFLASSFLNINNLPFSSFSMGFVPRRSLVVIGHGRAFQIDEAPMGKRLWPTVAQLVG